MTLSQGAQYWICKSYAAYFFKHKKLTKYKWKGQMQISRIFFSYSKKLNLQKPPLTFASATETYPFDESRRMLITDEKICNNCLNL